MNFEIRTERLLLRPVQEKDVPVIFKLTRDNHELTKFLTWNPPKALEDTRRAFSHLTERMERGELVRWGIFENKKFAGIVSIEDIVHTQRAWQRDSGELGYWLAEPFRGRGIMTEAARAAVTFGFESLKLHKIKACCICENEDSRHVLEHIGFRLVGTTREDGFRHGQWWDHFLFEMTASEFRALKK